MGLWAGTKLKFKPGIVMGGRNLVHDCGLSRAIGYFLEPLIVLGLFAKKPLTITLKGNRFRCCESSPRFCLLLCAAFLLVLLN